jgi:hypothetical protein
VRARIVRHEVLALEIEHRKRQAVLFDPDCLPLRDIFFTAQRYARTRLLHLHSPFSV